MNIHEKINTRLTIANNWDFRRNDRKLAYPKSN